ncbi:MAG: hypothetical protein QM820_46985 [Minicystis sp.]
MSRTATVKDTLPADLTDSGPSELFVDWRGRLSTRDQPATGADPITPNDSSDLAFTPRALLIGAGGTLKLDLLSRDGSTRRSGITINVSDGQVVPLACILRVYATGTTATPIIGLS